MIQADNLSIRDIVRQEVERLGPGADLNHIDVSQVTDFYCVFSSLDWDGDISRWDTSNATSMVRTFGESRFNGDISKWNVARVTCMKNMFERSAFNGDISNWDVSRVKDTSWMFADSHFNGDISKWNVSNVHTMIGMFEHSVFSGDLRPWQLHPEVYASHVFGKILHFRSESVDEAVLYHDHFNTPYFSKVHLLHMMAQSLSFANRDIEHQRVLCQQLGLNTSLTIERLFPMFSEKYQHLEVITPETSFSF